MADQTPKAEIVPFGKYKGQPVEILLADEGYRDWLMSQDWFRARFTNIYQTIINYGAEPQETPEHNEMQASFLDDERCFRLAKLVYPGPRLRDTANYYARAEIASHEKGLANPAVVTRAFEVGGWDIVYRVNWLPYGEDIRVELKPDLGDDFPAVLRQVKQHLPNRDYRMYRCVVVRRASFERVAWEQVAAMFAASGIVLLREEQLAGSGD